MARIEWLDLKAHELRELAGRDAIVILPVGSVEQHGPHLPVQVDALLVAEVARNAARRLHEQGVPVVVAPTVWSGLAEHHMTLGGTFTLDFATFHALIRCLCSSLVRHGFRRIALLNGHGGNQAAITIIANELARDLGAPIAAETYWPLAAKAFAEILEAQGNVLHACEAETSMVLALRPELVDMEAAAAIEAPMTAPSRMTALFRSRSFKEVSSSGVFGVPAAASAEKGARLLDAAGAALADALQDPRLWPPPA
jgi:creatinine amidohydrolase